ncbi:MAG TPA: polyketide synthase, partial [Elusimicrobiota bacterium]|nr:polyketide synthase [Elusimicrobiota bacterium]
MSRSKHPNGRGDDPVAIVSIGALFPGTRSLADFWKLILEARTAAKEVPAGRWLIPPEKAYYPAKATPDKVYSKVGCFVEDFALDPAGLDLDPALIASLDPVFHFALHAGREAFRGAKTRGLDRRRVGVILGNIALPTDAFSAFSRQVLAPEFRKAFPDAPAAGAPVAAINRYAAGMPAALLAKALGLGGGHVALDAACASSLYALKLAVEELKAGRADAMLAGGLSRPDCLYTQMGFSQLRALSASGRCSPFDAKADGLVVGEGAGVFVLRRLSDAEDAGDEILALI